jgi:hypothetical protein
MEKNHVYKENLASFIVGSVWDTYGRSVKRFVPDSQSPQLRFPRFKQLQLQSSLACDADRFQERSIVQSFWDPKRSIRESGTLPLFLFSEDPVVCPNCGHVDIVSHGPAEPKVIRLASQAAFSNYKDALKEASVLAKSNALKPTCITPSSWNHRWKCKRCFKTFRWGVDKDLKFPFELWGIILSSFLEGDDLARINRELRKGAEKLGIKVSSISSEAVYNIVERAYLIMAHFEPIAIRKFADREVKLGTVEIDYSPYPIYTLGSRIKQQDLKSRNINFHDLIETLSRRELSRLGVRKRVFVYITGAIDVESRYPPPMVTDFSFDYRRSLKCLEQMIQTVGSKPHTIKCDGAHCHRNAVKMMLPDVELYTRTKAQCYNIVNHVERYWDELKDECMHPYRFMSLGTARLAVEFKRLEHIFLRPHLSLDKKTPAEFMSIRIPKSITRDENEKWQRFLKFAYTVIMMEKCADLRKF